MKYIKIFEDFKYNNQTGNNLTLDDIIDCIKNNGIIYSDIIINLPNNNSEIPLIPTSVDGDGLITIKYKNKLHYVNLSDVKKIEF